MVHLYSVTFLEHTTQQIADTPEQAEVFALAWLKSHLTDTKGREHTTCAVVVKQSKPGKGNHQIVD
ncbi:hypothetical protein LCGC14_0364250 [marine sediment metagenome]|uniref:Uncharacterized protein n=1 Tax=marine sediment metagenome TaxID=412755 RepID=A0A0F9VUE2_9ZZZZ